MLPSKKIKEVADMPIKELCESLLPLVKKYFIEGEDISIRELLIRAATVESPQSEPSL